LKIDIENQQVLIDIGRNQLKEPLGRDQIKAQEMRVMAVKDILENLALQKSFLEIKSPFTGIIIDMQAAKGESIKAGNPICVMERFDPGTKIWFYATFGSGAGKLLHEGSKVELELDSVDAKEYGYLLGSVRRISTFPVSDSQLISVVKIPQIVQFLKQGQAVNYEVEIDLLLDPLTQSGFKWTTAEGPPIKIETGTTAIIRGIIVEKHPIYYLLPGRY
jgi:HlyD family secretion protein